MNHYFRVQLRAVYVALVLACVVPLVARCFQRSAWNKAGLYKQLLSGNEREQLRAASALAEFGGQKQLLDALQSTSSRARAIAQKALEYTWFHAAGSKAFRLTQSAYDAAEQNRLDEALATLDLVVKQFPNFAEGWNQRASVLWQMGAYEKSIADSKRAIALNPNHYGAWQGLGVCWLKLGDVGEACRSLREALKILPYDGATLEALHECEGLMRKRAPKPGASMELI